MQIAAVASAAPIEVFGVRLVGISAESGRKLLLSIALVIGVMLTRAILRRVIDLLLHRRLGQAHFWARQILNLVGFLAIVVGLVSLWFDEPSRLATALGLVTAGLAFALQKVVTAIAGYFVILRGKTFGVGDRIVMGGVRGDVIALDFTQTTIMEMGQPPPVQRDEPAMWVQSRQYTGRIVTVSNARVFDEPIYNYTREFPYIWEELAIPIYFHADRVTAERILLETADDHTRDVQQLSTEDREELARRYRLRSTSTEPRVYYRLTDNWLELTVRFLARDAGVREVKDAIARDVLRRLDEAGIEIASSSYRVTVTGDRSEPLTFTRNTRPQPEPGSADGRFRQS